MASDGRRWVWGTATAVLMGGVVAVAVLADPPPAPVAPERHAAATPPPREAPAPEPVEPAASDATGAWAEAVVFGQHTLAGSKRNGFLRVSESFAGAGLDIPVLIVRGARRGPTLCLTAGIHGDELNGVEIVRQIFQSTSPGDLHGTIVGLPVVNVHGFRSSSRYLPDRRDLNRYFPGHPDGSSAARISHAVFQALLESCDMLVDFHTGSFHRNNLPQVRGDLTDDSVLGLGRNFGVGVVVHNRGLRGTLRRTATEAGLPTITYEAGEPMRFSENEIAHGVDGVRNLLAAYGMRRGSGRRTAASHIYYRSRWVRTNEGGIFLTARDVGDAVRTDALLGTVTDPISNQRTEIHTPFAGRIIGMAVPQVVIPGFAVFHIGLEEQGEPRPDADEGEAPGGFEPDDVTPDQLDEVEQPE